MWGDIEAHASPRGSASDYVPDGGGGKALLSFAIEFLAVLARVGEASRRESYSMNS